MATKGHAHDDTPISHEFHDLVNMTPKQLETWLDTDESKAVGQKTDGRGESTGHHMGHEIVALLHTKKADYTDDDVDRMRKVTGYIKRHTAQRPDGNMSETPWRYSLMNWRQDPSTKKPINRSIRVGGDIDLPRLLSEPEVVAERGPDGHAAAARIVGDPGLPVHVVAGQRFPVEGVNAAHRDEHWPSPVSRRRDAR